MSTRIRFRIDDSLKLIFKKSIRCLSGGFGEIVFAVRVEHLESIGDTENFENDARFIDRLSNSLAIEIGIMLRRATKERPRCDGSNQLWEVKGNTVGIGAVFGSDTRHVARACPTSQVSTVVFVETGEPTARYDGSQPFVEYCGEDGIVATQ